MPLNLQCVAISALKTIDNNFCFLPVLGGGEGLAVLLQPHVYEGSKAPFLVPNKNSSRFVLCRPSKYVRAINPCQSFSHVFLPCLQALLESECSSSSG